MVIYFDIVRYGPTCRVVSEYVYIYPAHMSEWRHCLRGHRVVPTHLESGATSGHLTYHVARTRRHLIMRTVFAGMLEESSGGRPKPRLNQLNICTNSSHFLSLVSSYSAKLGCSQCSGRLWTSVYLHPYIHSHPSSIHRHR